MRVSKTGEESCRTPAAVLVAGPTASGKSALAVEIAERIGGTVINADSMQVYAELRVLSARPTREDEDRVPHRLYGHAGIAGTYSAGRWLDDAAEALREVREAGRIPVFAGGTGLYFKALTEGLSPVPAVDGAVRAGVRRRLDAQGAPALHRELGAVDPETAARIAPGDSQRIVRALEVFEATGVALSQWQRAPRAGAPVDPARALRIVLDPARDELRARIDRRVDAMIAGGALDEAAAIARLGLDEALPGMRAHGLRALMAHLRGDMALDMAAERMRAETRQYAKRQRTWHRQQMADWWRPAAGEDVAGRVAGSLDAAEARVGEELATFETRRRLCNVDAER